MRRISRNRWIWISCVAVIGAVIFLLNFLTPYLADDYSYSVHVIFGTGEKLSSVSDVLLSGKNFYMKGGGRVEGYFFTIAFSYLPPILFDILNTIGYLLATALIYLICRGNGERNLSLYLMVHLLLWICVPDYGQVMFWMCGSANYLWPSVPILLMIYLFRSYALSGETMGGRFHNPFWAGLFFLVGVIAGWGMENASAGMLAILTLYLVYFFKTKIKISYTVIAGYAGSLIGFMMLVLAPGNFERAGSSEALSAVFKFFIIDYYMVMFVGLLVTGWLVLRSVVKRMDPDSFHAVNFQSVIFGAGTFCSAYCLVAAPTVPERTWYIVCVYAIIAVGIFYGKINLKQNVHMQKLAATAVAGVSVLVLVAAADTMISSYEISVQTKAREAYILEQKARGNMDIATAVISHRYPLRANHDALVGLSDLSTDPQYWINKAVAAYYGVNSVTGVLGG